MLISGKWLLCDDDIIRPIVEGLVSVNDGSALLVEFLVDTGADRTAFSPEKFFPPLAYLPYQLPNNWEELAEKPRRFL